MNNFLVLAGAIFFIGLLSALTRHFIERALPYRLMLALFFPGVIIHEIFHAVASFAVGAKIRGISFFSARGGSVTHESPRLPFGHLIISLAPFLGGLALIVFSEYVFAGQLIYRSPTTIDFWRELWGAATSLWFWITIYILYSVGATMLPSWQDAQNSFLSMAALTLMLYGLHRFDFFAIPAEIGHKLASSLFSAMPFLLLFFGVSFFIYLARRIYAVLK